MAPLKTPASRLGATALAVAATALLLLPTTCTALDLPLLRG